MAANDPKERHLIWYTAKHFFGAHRRVDDTADPKHHLLAATDENSGLVCQQNVFSLAECRIRIAEGP